MTLQTIMAEIQALKHFADEEVTEQPRETLGGRLARQKKAKEDLKSLTESYRQSLLQSAVFLLVTGPGREAFLKKAVEVGFFNADPNQFYSDIVNQISPQLYEGKESSPGVLDVVSRILENKAIEVGVVGYPMVTFRQEFRRVTKNRDEFQELVKEIISTQVGTEVVGAQAVRSILNDALNAKHAGKTTPILLAMETLDQNLVTGLKRISHRVGVITVEVDDVSSATLKKVLSEIKGQMATSTIASYSVKENVPTEPAVTTEATVAPSPDNSITVEAGATGGNLEVSNKGLIDANLVELTAKGLLEGVAATTVPGGELVLGPETKPTTRKRNTNNKNNKEQK